MPLLKSLPRLMVNGLLIFVMLIQPVAAAPRVGKLSAVAAAALPVPHFMPNGLPAATVHITTTGFDPAQVTVQPGDTVEWINETEEPQRILSGIPYRIYLPLVLRNQSGTRFFTRATSVSPSPQIASEWFSGDMAPGGRFTHTFNIAGEYPYYLAGNVNATGIVIVVDTPQPDPDFTLAVTPVLRVVAPGAAVTYTVALTPTDGFAAPVTLAVTGLPTGATAHWSANPVTPSGSAVLTVTTITETPAGDHTLMVSGDGGSKRHQAQATLRIEGECVPVTDVSFTSNSPVELGQPMHFTATITPTNATMPLTYTWDFGAGPVQGVATMAHTFAMTGTHAVTLTVENPCGQATYTANVVIVEVGACIEVTDASFTSDSPVELGQPVHFTATVTPVHATTPLTYTWDFGAGPMPGAATMTHTFAMTGTHVVTLTMENPCGVAVYTDTVTVTTPPPVCELVTDVSFTSDSPVELGQPMHFTATVTPAHATLPLIYTWNFGDASPPLGGTEGGIISHTFATTGTHIVTLTVENPCSFVVYTDTVTVLTPPDFTVTVQPATQTITRGQHATYTVTATALHSFAEPVTLTLTGAPDGAVWAWFQNPFTPTAQTTLHITTSTGGPTGTFALHITGAAETLSRTTAAELVIVAEDTPPEPDFLLSITPDYRVLHQGQSAAYEVALTALFGFAESVTFQVDGLPDGAMATWTQNPLTPYSTVTTTLTVTTTDATPVGDYTLNITGTGGGKVHALQAGLDVALRPLPNLLIETITTEPGVPVAGQPFTVQVRIANRDIAHAIGAFAVDWYAAQPLPPTLAGDLTWTQHTLAAGQAVTLTGAYTFTTVGTYPLYAQVDRTNVISERDELDNVTGPVTLTVSATPQPDLIITALSVMPLTPTVGRPATVTVRVRNQGTLSTTGDVRVDAYFTTTPPVLGQAGDLSATLPPLEPGASALATLPYTFTTSSPQTVYAQVDPFDAIAESVESNNVSAPLTLTVRTPLPDLIIESITFTPTVGWLDEPVTATVTVRNMGDADAGPFRADWYLDPAALAVAGQTGDGHWDVLGLAMDASAELTLTHTFTETGTYWFYAQADTLEAVLEDDESNNVDGAYLAVVDQSEDVCGNIAENTTWVSGCVYYVTCDVTVNSGVTLTIEPGTVVLFSSGRSMHVNGRLSAQGTASQNILLTSNDEIPTPGSWGRIHIAAGAMVTFDYVVLKYGGYSTTAAYRTLVYNRGMFTVRNSQLSRSVGHGINSYDAALTITNSTIAYNGNSGINIRASGGAAILNNIVEGNAGAGISLSASGDVTPTIVGNIAKNNGTYPLMVEAGTHRIMLSEVNFRDNQGTGNGIQGVWITGAFAGTLIPQSDLVYVTDNIGDVRSAGTFNYRGSLTVRAEDEFVLRPGVIIKFTPPGYGTFLVYGVLRAQGTAANPVVFTSLRDDVYGGDTNGDGDVTSGQPGNWSGIRFMQGSQGILDHFIGRYGGNHYYFVGTGGLVTERGAPSIVIASSADLTLTHSQIAYSARNGLGASGTVLISKSIFHENGERGLLATSSTSGAVLITETGAISNGDSGIYVGGNGSNRVENCLAESNGDSGIRISTSGIITVLNNIVEGNAEAGISLSASGDVTPTIVGNIAKNNGTYPLMVEAGTHRIMLSEVNFRDNQGTGNNIQGVWITGAFAGTLIPQSTLVYVTDNIGEQQSNQGVITVRMALEVRAGDELVLKPGVIIKFTPPGYGTLRVYGVLRAQGTADNPVVFTSLRDDVYGGDTNGDGDATSGQPGNWGGIGFVAGSQGILDHFIGRYGGNYYYYVGSGPWQGQTTQRGLTSIISASSADLTLTNSHIAYSARNGASASGTVLVSHSIFRENGERGLSATSTTSGRVLITATEAISNGGAGISVTGSGIITVTNNIVEGNGGSGISLSASGDIAPTVVGNTANNNDTYPLMMTAGSRRIMLTESSFHDNQGTGNGIQGVWLTGAFAGTLVPQLDLVYVTDNIGNVRDGSGINYQGSLEVRAGDDLTLKPGVIIKFTPPGYGTFLVYGVLRVQGTANNPVIFTSLRDDVYGGDTNRDGNVTSGQPGNWSGIRLMEGSQGIFDHFIGQYGGNYYYSYNRLTGVTVIRGLTSIISASSADLTLTNSQIVYSARNGIIGNSASLIVGNMIFGNTDYGVSGSSVNARNNWWGHVTGPYHSVLNPNGEGNSVGNSVDFTPWIGKQMQDSGVLITNALPDDPLRNTAEMEPGVPYIVSVKSQHNFFLFGNENSDLLTVAVDWNGSEEGQGSPGSVNFKVRDTRYYQTGDISGIRYNLPTSILKAGFNDVELIAWIYDGNQIIESKSFTVRIFRFYAPKWLLDLGFNGTGIKFTQKPEYTEVEMYVKFPAEAFEAKANIPSIIPLIGGETGVKKSQATLNVSVRSDLKGTVKLEGKTGFEANEQEVGGTLWGEGQVGFTPNNTLALYKAKMGLELNGTIKAREPIVVVIPPLATVAQTPIIGDILRIAYIEGKIEPGINFEAGFESESDGSNLRWVGCEGGGDMKLTLSLGVEVCKNVEASVYGGGEAAIKLQAPPDPSYLKELSGGFFVGAKIDVLGFEANAEKTWEWSYEPQSTRMLAGATTLTAPLPEMVARPVLTTATDWHIPQPDYSGRPYAQFVSDRLVRTLHAPMGISSVHEAPIVTNLYAQVNPALALRDADAVLVWVHDNTTLPASQSKEIMASWWNGATWAAPLAVTDNTMSEFNPAVALVSAEQAIAVWERINDLALPMTATFDLTTTRKVELTYSVFDLNTYTWNTPVLLTTNTALDHSARLAAGQDEAAMTVWVENPAGELIGSADAPDTLRYALWDGASWNISGTVATDMAGVLDISLAYHDVNSATLVLSVDMDGVFSTTHDIELFYTSWDGVTWETLTQLTENVVADESPAVLYTAAGERRLVWLQDNQLMMLDHAWDAAPVNTNIASESATLRNFQASMDADDNLMLLWQGMSEEGADLYYTLYDAETATWSNESQLTHSYAMEKQISPAFDPTGQLMVAYALDHLTETVKVISPTLIITGVTEYDYTDLYVLHYTPETDLTVSDLALPQYFENPWPGDSVDVAITVQNAGAWGVLSPTVALYDGDPALDGTLVATHTLAGPLAGGAAAEVSIYWTVPVTPVQPHTLYAVVDPDNAIDESDEANNVLTLTTVTPDVAIASVKTYYYDQHNVVPLAVIANNGPVTATNVLVEFRAETITGTVEHTAIIAELAPQGLVAITTTWNVTGWEAGEYTYYAVLDSEDTIFEVNEEDNSDYFPVKVLPDLVIYSGDVQANLTESGGPVTVTVRNWGTADAVDVPIVLYEGPVITTSATALYTWTVASLPVDSDGNVQLVTTLAHRPNRLFAIADPQQTLAEISRHNNVALLNQPISLTFRYHDLESLIPPTATLTLEGDWAGEPYTLTGAGGVYSVTLSTAETPLTYRYAVDGNLALLNTAVRVITPTQDMLYDDYRAVTPDDVVLVGPATLEGAVGAPTAPITAHVTLADVTVLPGATFVAEIGYGTSAALTEWTWTPITYVGVVGNAVQFAGAVTPAASGVYSYTVRFDGNWGAGNPHNAWLYADLDGWANGFDLGQVGVLTVP